MSRIVIALGGNALALPKEEITISSQFAHAREALREVAKLAKDGHEIVITHGNGPQVGAILIRVEEALGKTYRLPLEVCVAESEGELGYMLDQSLYNALRDEGVDVSVASLLTQVIVNGNDSGFQNPTKPIGPFYTEKQAKVLQAEGLHMAEDAGRGWRRVVASPKPLNIVEAATIRKLVEQKIIVIAAGGGGIPVVEINGRLEGVPAVIDKDFASAKLANAIGADMMLIVTGVQYAYTHFGSPKQEALYDVSAADMTEHLSNNEFSEGSMKPKVEAALLFLASGGKKVVITDPAHMYEVLRDTTQGTTITT